MSSAIGSKVYTNKDNKQGTSYFNMAMKDVYKQCTAMTGMVVSKMFIL